MKRSIIITLLSLVCLLANAQHFYYVEDMSGNEVLIKEKLRNARQFVIGNPLASDYILKTSLASSSADQFCLRMKVVDSLSFEIILETEEKYALNRRGTGLQLTIPLAIQTLLEKNLKEMILAAGRNHLQVITKELRAKKDKT